MVSALSNRYGYGVMSEPSTNPIPDDHFDDADDVPALLHSTYSGLPFAECLVCHAPLNDVEMHVVEKVIRNGEAVLEMALCGDCCNDLSKELSEESIEVLRAVQETWMDNGDEEGEICAGCNRDRAHDGGFVLAGYFLPGRILMRQLAVCEACHEGVQRKLSRKTRDKFGEFVGNHFPGVPENVDAPTILV